VLSLANLYQKLTRNKDAIQIYKELIKTTKFSLTAAEELIKLGIKWDELLKIPLNIPVDW
jgi:hypothetical protein